MSDGDSHSVWARSRILGMAYLILIVQPLIYGYVAQEYFIEMPSYCCEMALDGLPVDQIKS